MPRYEYKCAECKGHTEITHAIGHMISVCGWCGGNLELIISASPIIFKGSGWTVNETRKKK